PEEDCRSLTGADIDLCLTIRRALSPYVRFESDAADRCATATECTDPPEVIVGVLAGSISYTLYHVDGEVPDRDREECLERIAEFEFRPLLADAEEDTSLGWVRIDDMLRCDFTNESVYRDEYVLLSMRTDRWSFPSALLRATVAQRTQTFLEEKGRTR